MTELIGEPIVSLTRPQGHQRERVSEMRREEIADVAGSEVVSLCVVSLSEKTVDFRYFRHFRTFQWELAATQEPQGAPTQGARVSPISRGRLVSPHNSRCRFCRSCGCSRGQALNSALTPQSSRTSQGAAALSTVKQKLRAAICDECPDVQSCQESWRSEGSLTQGQR